MAGQYIKSTLNIYRSMLDNDSRNKLRKLERNNEKSNFEVSIVLDDAP